VLATVLAQTSTKKLASASASKLKTHAALSPTQFSTRRFALAQTLASLLKRIVTSSKTPQTSIATPANVNAIFSLMQTKTKLQLIPIAMLLTKTSFLTAATAVANAALNKPVVQALTHQTSIRRPANANATSLLMQMKTKQLLIPIAMLLTKTSSSTAATAVANVA
jgi:hypothetical protein